MSSNELSIIHVEYRCLASIVVSKDGAHFEICGRTLINDRFVFTAAHCVNTTRYDAYKLIVTLGATTKEDRFNRPRLDVEAIKRHPKYDEETFKYYIALIKLKTPFRMNSTVSPICLFKERGSYHNLFATGFGFFDNGLDEERNSKIKPGNELRVRNFENSFNLHGFIQQ